MHAAEYSREIAAWLAAGHSRNKKSRHRVSAHSALLQRSKLSMSTRDDELHECQQTSLHCGVNDPSTPAEVGFEIKFANSTHSLLRSLSTRPARQMASVLGRISDLINASMDAWTAIGGGGGVGGGSTDTSVLPGGGGGAAAPLSQTTESASRPLHGSMRAYL